MDSFLKCPNCGQPIELTAALKKQIEGQVLQEQEKRHQFEILKIREQTEVNVRKLLEAQVNAKLKFADQEAAETKKQNAELQKQLFSLTTSFRQLKKEKEDIELMAQKKLIEEEDKIRSEERLKAREENLLKILEKDKQLQDALRQIEELKTKMQQGSQQIQGEVLELALESLLKNNFPNDNIKPVPKGIRGADIIQEVTNHNQICGRIVWEMKNAKAWTDNWVVKLKEDQRTVGADVAVLVSTVLPKEIKTFGTYKHDDLWLTDRKFVVGLATALRLHLISLAAAQRALVGKNEKMETMFKYLSGIEFKQRVEAIVETFSVMQEDMEKEKRWYVAKWAKQEKILRRIIEQTHGMYGDLQSIMGKSLPQIKTLQLEDGE